MGDEGWNNVIIVLVPTVLVGLLFWFAMRAIVRADRTERKVYSEIEVEERARFERERAAAGDGPEAAPAREAAPTREV